MEAGAPSGSRNSRHRLPGRWRLLAWNGSRRCTCQRARARLPVIGTGPVTERLSFMASPAGTRPAPPPPGDPGQPVPSAGPAQGAALGLASATALVMGSIIGVGVFTMPAVLAAAGTSSLVVMAVVAAGAMLPAVLFGQLTRRVPNADGGLYAYARHEFGDFAGYLTAWSYWISSWAGNAAIVTSWV